MIFDIDKRESTAIAAIDDRGAEISYGQLMDFCAELRAYIPTRSFIFIMAENAIGALAGYVASIENKVVPLILSANTEKGLFENLYDSYQPQYLWMPEAMDIGVETEEVARAYGFRLVKTGNTAIAMNDELSFLLPTSGSTGSSKLVRHSYENIDASAESVAKFFELRKSDRPLAILPMHYTMGLSVVNSHLYAGATLLMVSKSMLDPGFWSFLKGYKATSITGVPYSYEILKKMRFTRMDLPHLTLITQGGGKMNDENFKFFAQWAADNGKRFIATYGQTECTARMAFLPSELAVEKTGSIGYAIPGGRFYLTSDDGEVFEKMEAEGQLVYQGPNVTLGYAYSLNDFVLGDENEGVMITGDMARRDADGCYYITGRKSRFLKLFGYRVGLDECEDMLKSELGIECACVGDDNQLRIYLTQEKEAAAAKDILVKKLSLVATVIDVKVIDKIPRNEAGKVMYSQLFTA